MSFLKSSFISNASSRIEKAEKAETNGLEILYDVQKLKQFTQKLPFELTNAQKRVTNEICRDLRSPQHMQRLLQEM